MAVAGGVLGAALLMLLAIQPAHAACTSPAGIAGDVVYGSNNIMAFCNGTVWVNMGTNLSIGFGTLTTGDFCTATSATQITCTTGTINLNSQASGTLQAAQFPALTGDVTTTAGNLATTVGSVGGKAITLGGSFITSGASSLTLTTTGATNVTLPTSGTLVNTAVTNLSTLSSVGTITSGIWNGTPIAVAYGGTGSGTATGGLSNLLGNPVSGTYSISCTSSSSCTYTAAATGSGTVSSGTQYQNAYYGATGTTISGDATITTDAGHDFILTTGNLAIGTTAVTNAINLKGSAAQTIGMGAGSAAGNNLTLQSGSGFITGTNENGGNLILASGVTTGTGTSSIQFSTYPAGSSGTATNGALAALTVGATGTTGSTANTTLQGNAGSGTNQNGGTLTLASGVSTGTGTSTINFNVYPAGSTGSTPNAATTAMTIASTGYVGIGTTSPAGKLEVVDTGNDSGMTSGMLKIDAANHLIDLGRLSSTSASGDEVIVRGRTGTKYLDVNASTAQIDIGEQGSGGNTTPINFWRSNTNVMTILNSGYVGIGTASPAYALQVSQSGSTTSSVATMGFTGSVSGNASRYALDNYQGLQAAYGDRLQLDGYWGLEIRGNTESVFSPFDAGGATDTALTVYGGATNTYPIMQLVNNNGTATFLTVTGAGSVGIGTTTPDASLDFSQKTDAVSLPAGTTGQRPTGVNGMIRYNSTLAALEAYANGAWASLAGSGALTGSGTSNYVARWTPNGNTLGIGTLYDNGTQVGIGTTSPSEFVDIVGASKTIASGDATIFIRSSDTQAADKGGSVIFGGQDGATSNRTFATIAGFKENSTSGNYNGYLAFATRANGANPAEAMRITSAGYVGIGTSSPGALLNVSSATNPASGDTVDITLAGIKAFQVDKYGNFLVNQEIGIGYDGTRTAEAVTTSSYPLYLTTDGFTGSNDNILLMPNGSGNVGIGTTSPYSGLTVLPANLADPSLTHGVYSPITLGNASSLVLSMGQSVTNAPYYYYMQVKHDTANISGPLALNPLGGNVGIGTTTPDASLDLSQKTDAVSLPAGTTGQRPTGVNGMIRYNSTLAALEAYANGAWASLAGSGALAGSGTANYVARWTPNGTTLGIGTLYDDGTNVGIGTTNSQAELQIVGSGAGSYAGFPSLVVNSMPNDAPWNEVFQNASNPNRAYDFGMFSANDGEFILQFVGNPSYPAVIDFMPASVFGLNANDGIEVDANFEVLDPTSTNSYFIVDNSAGGVAIGTSYAGVATPPANGLIVSGNVGIGTTSPGAPLTVVSPSGVQANFISTGTHNGYIDIDNAAGGNQSAIGLSDAGSLKWEIGKHYDNSFFEYDASSAQSFLTVTAGGLLTLGENSQMSLPAGGNVGIGTTSPVNLLNVYGGPIQVSAGTASTPATAVSGLVFARTDYPTTYTNQIANSMNSAPVLSSMIFEVNNGASSEDNVMTLLGNGFVGIGTTSPSDLLHVETDQNAATTVKVKNTSSGSAAIAQFVAHNGTNYATFGVNGTGITTFGASAANDGYVFSSTNLAVLAEGAAGAIKFGTGSSATEAMRITSTGNVGIGTTSPADTLTVYTATNDAGIQLQGATASVSPVFRIANSAGTSYARIGIAGANGAITTSSSANDLVIRSEASNIWFSPNSGSAGTMILTPGGNVGIGTTSPNAALQIGNNTGSASPRQLIMAEYANSGSGRPLIIGDQAAATWWGIGPADTAADNNIRIGNVAGTNVDWAATQNINLLIGGSVGIGTTSSYSNLTVLPQNLANPSLTHGVYSPITLGNSGSLVLSLGQSLSSTPYYYYMQVKHDTADVSGPLAINPLGGNVGIGTTSPQATLDVYGYTRLKPQSSQPAACSSTNDGAVALTAVYTLCVCKGASSAWYLASNGTTACTW